MMEEKNEFLEQEKILVTDAEKGKRLDVFLAEIYEEHSRSYLKRLIQDALITVNGKKEKSGYKLNEKDCIEISFPETEDFKLEAENIPLDIIYQDQDIAVINKPKGMVVHPAVGNLNGTLVNAIMYHIKDLSGINGELRPGIVHRIDKDTTGLLVIAKNDFAHRALSEQIKSKICKREYIALVHGAPHKKEDTIQTFIGRSFKDRKKMAVVREGEGRVAITEYKLLEKFGNFSLMYFKLHTGRTHQIRVHCKYLNIPIVGDQMYCGLINPFGIKAQMLHAKKLTLIHPRTNQEMKFEAPLPSDFEKVLQVLECKLR